VASRAGSAVQLYEQNGYRTRIAIEFWSLRRE
jgi:hypothetical protein